MRARGTASTGGGEEGPDRAGWFRYHFDSERWVWSDEVYRIHGYDPGAVDLTTELVLSHKHSDDVASVAALLEDIRASRTPLSSRHRMIDVNGREHSVVLVGDLARDDAGSIVGVHGFYIVEGTTLSGDDEERITERVTEIVENRSAIEHAKGMLMLVYGIEPDAAFELLRWRSQVTNTRLRNLSEQVVRELAALGSEGQLPPRSVFDKVLMTVHERAGVG